MRTLPSNGHHELKRNSLQRSSALLTVTLACGAWAVLTLGLLAMRRLLLTMNCPPVTSSVPVLPVRAHIRFGVQRHSTARLRKSAGISRAAAYLDASGEIAAPSAAK